MYDNSVCELEMIFIFLLALILFGPKRLPEMAREIGKFVAEFKRASNDFKYQLQSEIEKAGNDVDPSSLACRRRSAANSSFTQTFCRPPSSRPSRHRRGPRTADADRPHGFRRPELHLASARSAGGGQRRKRLRNLPHDGTTVRQAEPASAQPPRYAVSQESSG